MCHPCTRGFKIFFFCFKTTHFTDDKYEKNMEMKFKPWSFLLVSFTLKAALYPLYHYTKKPYSTQKWKLQREVTYPNTRCLVATFATQSGPLEGFSPSWSSWKTRLKTTRRLFRQIYQTFLPIICVLRDKKPTCRTRVKDKREILRNMETLALVHPYHNQSRERNSCSSQS